MESAADVHGHDTACIDLLVPLVYQELRQIAHRERYARPNDTLSTTGLVHEAYLKLASSASSPWRNRAHFLSVAAIAMRQVLVDLARRRATEKHGGALQRVTLDDGAVATAGASAEQAQSLLDLDDALVELHALDTRLARVVECRFFGGMTEQETADALDVTERTVRRDWVKARGWLYRSLRG